MRVYQDVSGVLTSKRQGGDLVQSSYSSREGGKRIRITQVTSVPLSQTQVMNHLVPASRQNIYLPS